MKRNLLIFIALILVASSFKYRTMAVETELEVIPVLIKPEDSPVKMVQLRAEFERVVLQMQKANAELAHGNADPVKQLWSHQDEVAIFCGSGSVEVKGWESVEDRLNWLSKEMAEMGTYRYEKVSSHVNDNFASLQQKEHYRSPDGKAKDLAVTVLFRKEGDSWKIFHRRAERLSSGMTSM